MKKLLIIPLGYGWEFDELGKPICDREGEERIRGAIFHGLQAKTHKADVLYGALPGIVPPTRGTADEVHLGRAMVQTFIRYRVPADEVVRGQPSTWGTLGEVREGLRIADELTRSIVFVTSRFHVRRVRLTCIELLGVRGFQWKLHWNTLRFVGVTTKHAAKRDRLTEPVKQVAQLARIPFGRFLPETLNGHL